MFAHVVEDHFLRDRREAEQPRLPPVALDVVVLDVAVAAVGLNGAVGRLAGRFGRHVLGDVGLLAARRALVVQRRGLADHQFRGFELGERLGQRKLDALILADRPAEDLPFPGVLDGLFHRPFPHPDALGRDQDAFGVDPVQNVVEAAALFADEVFLGDVQVVDEQHVGIDRLAPEFVQFLDLDRLRVDVGEEEAHAQRFLLDLVERRGAREQQHLLGFLRLGDEDLLAVHEIAVAVSGGEGGNLGRVGAGVGFGHRERHVHLAAQNRRQIFVLGLPRAVFDERFQAENAEMDGRARLGAAPALRHGLHDQRGFGDAQPRAAVLFGDGDAEPAAVGDRPVEFPGKLAVVVPLAPVFVGKTGAQRAHLLLNFLLFVGQPKIHVRLLACGP